MTDRRGLHVAQLAHLAMQEKRDAAAEPAASYPERGYLKRNRHMADASALPSRLAWGAACVAVGLAVLLIRRKRTR